MKRLFGIVLVLLVIGCSSNSEIKHSITATPSASIPPAIRAVYFVQGQSQLAPDDLRNHPEVLVVHSWTDFTQRAQKPVALWLDKNVLKLVTQSEQSSKQNWLQQEPQINYPLVVVGSKDTWFSFAQYLTLCCFTGSFEETIKPVTPGFSVIKRQLTSDGFPQYTFSHGYSDMPTVAGILQITDALLDGTSIATPVPTQTPVATPTALPITGWTRYRDATWSVQLEYPVTWQVDAEFDWVLFYDPNTGQSFNLGHGKWIKQLPDDFVEHVVGNTIAMTQTLTIDHQPAVSVQIPSNSPVTEYQRVVGVIAPDGEGLILSDKNNAAVFQHALNSLVFIRP